MSRNLTTDSVHRVSRRSFLTVGLGAAAVGLGACAVDPSGGGGNGGGESSGGAGGDGPATGSIRFAWWGNAARQELIGDFAATFEDSREDVTVQIEPSEYSGYTDKLSVMAAGQNLPDVFWMPANQVTTFAARDVLLDTDTLAEGVLDLSQFDPAQLEEWLIDGKQYAPVYTQYSPAMQIDTTAFEAAGITDFPDDESWTWDDLGGLAVEYANAAGGENWGIANMSAFYQHAHLWIRQQGAEAFTADGEIGFDAEVIGSWFAWWQKYVDAGGVLPDKVSGGKEQWTQTGHKTALYLVQLNQFIDNQTYSDGHDLTLVKSPTAPGSTDDYQFKYYTRLCIAGNSKNPALAGEFVNFMLNDPSAAEAVGLASGIPSNPVLAQAVADLGDPVANKVLEIQARIDEQPQRPRPEPPVGGSSWQSLIETASDDIFNGGVPIDEAVKAGIVELQATLDKG